MKKECNKVDLTGETCEIGLPLGCSQCVLPVDYLGAKFTQINGSSVCNFCNEHQPPVFLGENQLLQDLNLSRDEKVGVTVSGGKDSLNTLIWAVDTLGPKKVVGFHHRKVGLTHPLAQDNLEKAKKILRCPIVIIEDREMLPRFQVNLGILLANPDPAMVRVALCAGCRFGISGLMFQAGNEKGVKKFITSASYLELAPFKSALMKAKGSGDEQQGLIRGLQEAPAYNYGNNVAVILREDQLCHKSQLTNGQSKNQFPGVKYFDYDRYFLHDPEKVQQNVIQRVDWMWPGDNSWHFDCVIETFKDIFYYGLLGYTETDYYLSAMVRHGLITRNEAINRLIKARKAVIDSQETAFALLTKLGVADLSDELANFYSQSQFLSNN